MFLIYTTARNLPSGIFRRHVLRCWASSANGQKVCVKTDKLVGKLPSNKRKVKVKAKAKEDLPQISILSEKLCDDVDPKLAPLARKNTTVKSNKSAPNLLGKKKIVAKELEGEISQVITVSEKLAEEGDESALRRPTPKRKVKEKTQVGILRTATASERLSAKGKKSAPKAHNPIMEVKEKVEAATVINVPIEGKKVTKLSSPTKKVRGKAIGGLSKTTTTSKKVTNKGSKSTPTLPAKRQVKEKAKGDISRINIVSERLCDDVIQRLGPSLKRHGNCDIIDVNPGNGLWSSKIHAALKPRTHILMEPDKEQYLPFLQPLLDQKGSTYKFIPESGILWDNLNKLETENHLPHQELLENGDPRLEKPNDTLLFIANLGYHPKKPYMGFRSITTLMIHQLLTATRAHSIFQGYGQVRMLLWMRDGEKASVMPRQITSRKKAAAEAEISCERLVEVAGSDLSATSLRREKGIDVEGARAVKAKMLALNIMTPPGRAGTLEKEAAGEIDFSTDSSVVRPYLAELNQLIAGFAAKEFPMAYDGDGNPINSGRGGGKGMVITTEYKRMKELQFRQTQHRRYVQLVDDLLNKYNDILEKIVQSDESTPEATALKKEHIEEMKAWEQTVLSITPIQQQLITQRLEDRRAFRQDPPMFIWDRREYEPLMVQAHEFYPKEEMCLLDIQPKSLWPVLREDNLSNYDYFEFMLAALFTMPTQSIRIGLRALAPGADDWILPRCPALTDLANGGSISYDHLSIRMLNQKMLRELIEAWIDWPFRPSKAEMMGRMSSASIHDEEP